MISIFSVLHCVVSNFAVSIVHQLFDLPYAKVTDIGEIKRIYFFPFSKRYSDIKRLQQCKRKNLILPTIQFCFRLDLFLGLKGDYVVKH